MSTCKIVLLWSFGLAAQTPLLHVNAVKVEKNRSRSYHTRRHESLRWLSTVLLVDIKRHVVGHIVIGKAVCLDKAAAAVSILYQPIDMF